MAYLRKKIIIRLQKYFWVAVIIDCTHCMAYLVMKSVKCGEMRMRQLVTTDSVSNRLRGKHFESNCVRV